MNVLSLFDGMSCGRIALERVGIPVTNYYASEIDKYAIRVSKANYPDIKHIGSVTEVKALDLPAIDLLIGGSPCQGFSFAGKQLNFEDPRSKLFFEYVRLLKEIRETNPDVKFILENVKMKKEYQDVISKELGVQPVYINSSLVSAQNRKRLYWTNIGDIVQPIDKKIVFEDIIAMDLIESIFIPDRYKPKLIPDANERSCKTIRLGGYSKQGQGQRVYSVKGKSICLSALGGGWGAKTGLYLVNRTIRKPTQTELERLQTVPDNYTRSVKYINAAKMLGNGWTVDVIAHIFKGLIP